jgi:hypothetical protein
MADTDRPKPILLPLGKKVSLRYGYPDGRVDIVIRTPWPAPDVTYTLDRDDVAAAVKGFAAAVEWDAQRKGKDDAGTEIQA